MRALYALPLIFAALPLFATPLYASEAEVVAAKASASGSAYRFDVTIQHPDTGWDHYADGWQVELADGTALGFRELLHPHVNEQPFTRSLGGVAIPAGVTAVFIRARDSQHGWSQDRYELTLN